MDFRPRILVSNTLVSTKIIPEYPTYSCNHIWYLDILYTVDTWISYTQLPPHTIPGWFTSVIKTIFNKMAFLSSLPLMVTTWSRVLHTFITLVVWEFAAQVGIKPTYFTFEAVAPTATKNLHHIINMELKNCSVYKRTYLSTKSIKNSVLLKGNHINRKKLKLS